MKYSRTDYNKAQKLSGVGQVLYTFRFENERKLLLEDCEIVLRESASLRDVEKIFFDSVSFGPGVSSY